MKPTLAIVIRFYDITPNRPNNFPYLKLLSSLALSAKAKSMFKEVVCLCVSDHDIGANNLQSDDFLVKSLIVAPGVEEYDERVLIQKELFDYKKSMIIYYDENSVVIPSLESFLEECQLILDTTTERARIQMATSTQNTQSSLMSEQILTWYSKSLEPSKGEYDNPIVSKLINNKTTQIFQPKNFWIFPKNPKEPLLITWLWFFFLNMLNMSYEYDYATVFFLKLSWIVTKQTAKYAYIMIYFVWNILANLIMGFLTFLQNVLANILSRTYLKKVTPKPNRFLDDFTAKMVSALSYFDFLEGSYIHLGQKPTWMSFGWGQGKFYPNYTDFATETLFYQGASQDLAQKLPKSFLDSFGISTMSEMLNYRSKSNQIFVIESGYNFNKKTLLNNVSMPHFIDDHNDMGYDLHALAIYHVGLGSYSFTKMNNRIVNPFFKFLDFLAIITASYYLLTRVNFRLLLILWSFLLICSYLNSFYEYWVLRQNKNDFHQQRTDFCKGGFNKTIYLFLNTTFPIGGWIIAFIIRYILDFSIATGLVKSKREGITDRQ